MPNTAYLETTILPRHHRRALKPSAVRMMTDVECAWMGAMFEGEGSINVVVLASQGRLPWPQVQINVTSTCLETLEKCRALTGAGTINPHNKATERRKQSWRWWLTGRLSVQDFLRSVYPYLTGKRPLALHALKVIERSNADA